MGGLIALAENFLIERALSNDAPLTGKNKTGLSLMALSGLLLALATSFFVYAGYLWLDDNYSPEIAAALTGGIVLALALLCAVISFAILQYKRSRIKKLKAEIIETMEMAIELANEELAEPVQKNPKVAVLIASAAGFIAGDRFL